MGKFPGIKMASGALHRKLDIDEPGRAAEKGGNWGTGPHSAFGAQKIDIL